MEIELGKKYKDEDGNIISVVSKSLHGNEKRKICAVICYNAYNEPTWYPVDGNEMQIGSMFRKKIVECLGDCKRPVYKEVSNRKGQKVDFLTNYSTSDGLHLGIVHVSEKEDALRLFSKGGKIIVPMKDSYDESLIIN